MVLLLGVDAPEIILLTEQEVPSGQQARQHGVVLVVVAVQPIAADGLEVLEPVNERANGSQAIAVAGVVDRIRFLGPEHASVCNVGGAHQADPLELALAERDELGIWRVPEEIVLGAEVLEAEAGLAGVRHHVGAPVLEVLDSAHADLGGVDVNPVVWKEVRLVHDQTDGEEVAVDELRCGVADRRGRRGRELRDKLGDGHTRDEVEALDQLLPPGGTDDDAVDPAAGPPHGHDLAVEPKHGLVSLKIRSDRFPYHPRTEPGVLELLDESLDRRPWPHEHVQERCPQREVFDALRRPLRPQLRARDPPDLLRVGLEEGQEQTPAEPIRYPLLEGVLTRIREELPAEIAEHDPDRHERAELEQRVERPERVVEETTVVVDAGEAGPPEQIVPEHLMPDLLHLRDFREEAVASHVEAEALERLGARETADPGALLDDDGTEAGLRQLARGRQPRGPRADDRHSLPGGRRPHRATARENFCTASAAPRVLCSSHA